MRESDKAKAAFEDYLSMGDGRSLRALREQYKEREQNGHRTGVPTVRLSTLTEWSRHHNWQARITEINTQQNALDRQETLQRLTAQREKIVDTVVKQIDLVNHVWETVDPTNITIESVRDLHQLVKATDITIRMIMSLLGEPLVEHIEHSGSIHQIGFHGTAEEFTEVLIALQANETEIADEFISRLAVQQPSQLPRGAEPEDDE